MNSKKGRVVEASIAHAYVQMIRNAERFIYIENQVLHCIWAVVKTEIAKVGKYAQIRTNPQWLIRYKGDASINALMTRDKTVKECP